MTFLNDEYTLQIDDLGYRPQVDKIRELILDADTPFSIGISGRWGSGKTSIMKYLMASLGGEPMRHRMTFHTEIIKEQKDFRSVYTLFEDKSDCAQVQAIWFNPWEHESAEEPFIELLKEIKNHFSMLQSLDQGKKIVSVSLQAGLDMLGSLLGLGRNQGSNVKGIGEKYEFDNFEYTARTQRFKLVFQDAVEKLLKQEDSETTDQNARLVIFVDDLDRCENDTIGKLLKEIKQYLSTQRCVFVFGYDRHHIERALATTATKSSKETRAYLEKLFQTTFYIKEPAPDKIRYFVHDQLEKFPFIANNARDELATFITEIVDPNPRRLKSYVIAFYFHVMNADVNTEPIELGELKKFALIAYLKLFYESVYSALENTSELLEDLIAVFKNRAIADATNQREYYFHLEMRSHLHSIPVLDIKVESTDEYETKFLNEVYEMHGKHKSFERFMEAFVNVFTDEPNPTHYF